MTAITLGNDQSATRTGEYFYVRMAVLCMLVAFVGFAPTYWIPLASGALKAAPIFHIHGVLFSGWTVFFVVQTALVATGRTERHRVMGLAGIAIATAMVIVGVLTSITGLKAGIALGYAEKAEAFSIVSMTGIVLFGALFAAAIANVHRPEVHKRLMLVATVSLLQAAVGRLFRMLIAPPDIRALPSADIPPPHVAITIVPGLVVDLIIVAAIVHDWRTRGRPHPTYLVAGGIVLAVQLLRVPVSETAAWRAVARVMVSLAA